jgi:glycosyltransferase involved in cell wall biosynthesis
VNVVGQGIDTKHFSPKPFFPRGSAPFTLLCVGRIARVKRLDVLLRAIKNLPVQANGRMVHCTIIGSTAPHDARYGEELCDAVVQSGIEDRVTFAGSVANRNMPDRYRGADVCVNLTERGFFDKTTLEAMACGRVVLVANEEFGNILPAELHNTLMFRYGDADMLATKLLELFNMTENERERIGATLRDIAVERYDVQGLAERITHVLNTEAYG